VLLVPCDQELRLGSESTLENAVIIIIGGDDGNPLDRFNKMGNRTDDTHSGTGFLLAKAELLPKNTVEL